MRHDMKSGLWLPERGLSDTEQRKLIRHLDNGDDFANPDLWAWWKRVSSMSGGQEGYSAIPPGATTQQVDGTAVTGTVAASLLAGHAKWTIPAGLLDKVGKWLRLTAKGRISNIVTTPGTLTLDCRMGPTANIVVWNGGAFNLNVVAKTNVSWMLELDLILRAVGSGTGANFIGIGVFQSESIVGSAANTAGGNGSLLLPVSAPAVGTGFDSTIAMLCDLFAAFSLTGNSIQSHMFLPELKN